jgi:hypothetical protein
VTEQHQGQSAPGATNADFLATPPEGEDPVDVRRKGCARCGNPFGLVRRRRHGRQFCSVACMDKGVDSVGMAGGVKTLWHAFFGPRR